MTCSVHCQNNPRLVLGCARLNSATLDFVVLVGRIVILAAGMRFDVKILSEGGPYRVTKSIFERDEATLVERLENTS
jgi:hypothetical protein